MRATAEQKGRGTTTADRTADAHEERTCDGL